MVLNFTQSPDIDAETLLEYGQYHPVLLELLCPTGTGVNQLGAAKIGDLVGTSGTVQNVVKQQVEEAVEQYLGPGQEGETATDRLVGAHQTI